MRSKLFFFTKFTAALFFVYFLSYTQYLNWEQIHHERMDEFIAAVQNVLNGTPPFRAFQNRVLTPEIINILGTISESPTILFAKLSLLTLNFSLFFLVKNATGKVSTGVFSVILATLIYNSLHHYWTYAWDFTEGGTLLLLGYFAYKEKSLVYFIALFCVSIFNRESAVFIALYCLIFGLWQSFITKKINYTWIGWGASLGILSYLITESMRRIFFIHSNAPQIGLDIEHKNFGNQFHFSGNLTSFRDMLLHQNIATPYWILIFFSFFIYITIFGKKERNPYVFSLGISMLSYLTSLVILGVIFETRIYQPLAWIIPFLTCGILINNGRVVPPKSAPY